MKREKSPPPGEPTAEVSALIETLHDTARRLEDLTTGEVDAVTNRVGQTILLRRAQDQLRHHEAAKQAAILNALPAHIALLDSQGLIISVNEAWRRFGRASAIQCPGDELGINYLEICDNARGDDAAEAHQVAAGIRSVLGGAVKSFSIEYPCHSPTAQRWFLLTVTPLADESPPRGVVVMHLNITARKTADQRFKDLLEAAPDAMVLVNHDGEIVLVNAQAVDLFGWRREELLGQQIEILIPDHFRDRHPAHRSGFFTQPRALAMGAGQELLGLRKDGSEFPVEISLSPLGTDEGTLVMSAIRDITERKRMTAAIIRSEERFRVLYESSPDAIMVVSPEQEFLTGNPATLALFGCRDEQEFTALSPAATSPQFQPDGRRSDDKAQEMMHLALDKGAHLFEWLHQRMDGTTFSADVLLLATTIDDRTVIQATVRDITERKEVEDGIRRLNRVYAVLSGINALIVRVRDRDELFTEACRIAVEDAGFRMAWIGIVDRSVMKIVPVASACADEELLTAIKDLFSSSDGALQGNSLTALAIREKKTIVSNDSQSDPEVLFSRKQAEHGIRSMATLPLIVSDEAVGVLVLYADEINFFHEDELQLLTQLAGDITFAIDHIDKQERLDYLAYYDVLTGLANRSLFLDRVTQYMHSAVSGGHKLAVFLIDLERFKNINDSLGQPACDALLRQVAQWLTHQVGDANLLARVSADHFAVVLPEMEQEDDVARLLEKTMQSFLGHPFYLSDAVFRIAFKVGVALFPNDGADADTLFRNAEAALKRAKASGERYLFYTQKMTARVAGKLTLENQLRQALDNEGFVLHYQPKMNLASGKLTGAEALIRWHDPRPGLVSPGRFIPILEETGMIHAVGRWAMCKAIEDYLRWRAAGLAAVRIAVNVSPLHLRNRGFIAEIEQVIGIDAHAAAGLELEITESLIMADVTHSIASLKAIRAMGVSIGIDDFGTGFSSLSYLSKLPVDTLKIDRSFVIDMTAAPEGLALVSTIINLAHSLKLNVDEDTHGGRLADQLRGPFLAGGGCTSYCVGWVRREAA